MVRSLVSAHRGQARYPGWYRVEDVDGIWGGRPVRKGRGSRTSDERLARVAEIYMRAVGDGRPPVQAVAVLPAALPAAAEAEIAVAALLAAGPPGEGQRGQGVSERSGTG